MITEKQPMIAEKQPMITQISNRLFILLMFSLLLINFSSKSLAADDKEIRIALVIAKTGVLEAYGQVIEQGFNLGLEYATDGTMKIAGKNINIIVKDTQTNAGKGKLALEEAILDDKVDVAIGAVSSGVTLAMMPLAAEHKKVLIVPGAVADSITSTDFSRYVFRTQRNSTNDALSIAEVVKQISDGQEVYYATLAQDYAYGKDGISAFQNALNIKLGSQANSVYEEYAPIKTTDFTAYIQHMFEALKDKKGKKIIFVTWAGAADPLSKIKAAKPEKYGISLVTGGNVFAVLKRWKNLVGTQGALPYYFDMEKNEVNNWLVKTMKERYNTYPDFFIEPGATTAIALVRALEKTNGDTNSENLISALEGLEFDSPLGMITIRAKDHQAQRPMYHFEFVNDPNYDWIVPKLIEKIQPDLVNLPPKTN